MTARLINFRSNIFALLLVPLFCVPLIVSGICVFSDGAMAAAKDKGGAKVGAKVGKPLKEAMELIKTKNYDAAVIKIKEAQGLASSPEEHYVVNDMLANVYQVQENYAGAAELREKDLNSPFVPEAEKQGRLKNLVALFTRAKNPAKSNEYATLYAKTYGADKDTNNMLAYNQFQAGDYAGTIATLKPIIDGGGATEATLALQLNAQRKLNDVPGAQGTLKRLALNYPSDKYWGDYLNIIQVSARDNRVIMQTYRLQKATGTIRTADDYYEAAQLAYEKLGLPGEAQLFLNEAKAKGLMKASSTELLARANAQAGPDKASLPNLDRQAAGKASGQDYVTLGEAYASYGMYDQAIAAYEKGIAKGGLKDASEAKLNLGIAQIMAGQKAQAQTTLGQVPPGGMMSDFAQAWLAYIAQKG